MIIDKVCPKCKRSNLAVERRMNGNAKCLECKWSGPYKDCFVSSNTEIPYFKNVTDSESSKSDEELANEECFEYHGCFTGDCPHSKVQECAEHFFKAGMLAERQKWPSKEVLELVEAVKKFLDVIPNPSDYEKGIVKSERELRKALKAFESKHKGRGE